MDLADVAVEVTVRAGDTARPRALVLRCRWRAADPMAVQLELGARPDHPSLPGGRWTVLRDFLRYGLETATGDGDVRLEPGPGTLVLTLDRLSRPVVVALPRALAVAFLDATEQAVPSGAEECGTAVDDLVARLLRRHDGADG